MELLVCLCIAGWNKCSPVASLCTLLRISQILSPKRRQKPGLLIYWSEGTQTKGHNGKNLSFGGRSTKILFLAVPLKLYDLEKILQSLQTLVS